MKLFAYHDHDIVHQVVMCRAQRVISQNEANRRLTHLAVWLFAAGPAVEWPEYMPGKPPEAVLLATHVSKRPQCQAQPQQAPQASLSVCRRVY